MPRDGRPARLRLQKAAAELFGEHGFDRVTTAEIAARAGVTERTFYRHYADKREVFFASEADLRDALVAGVADAPEELEPLPALLWAFRTVVPVMEENRPLVEPMRRVIADTPALRERHQAKTAALTDALATALHGRGVAGPTASLAARVAMAAMSHAAAVWFVNPGHDLDRLLRDTFADVHALTAALAASDAEAARR
ncbi:MULTISPECIES: TetR/AcrR family transcriptional regulator [Streptomycetaceae]|uniref:TetR family transcriptional regulator n=1 Tax=Streptantibioticus cattleyicolor (strain ATCC 35852 / DSM 46488 / JCM 4925 / NBRC 14057 / NRRL 8057) TaxID=1003195 RepID=F8JP30_STREN|nr:MULTISPECIES: TetR/AcrR family transcriptional regulator [Streptomycetaceae]AEW93982.1 TetR family transcriptional regulator [Streptantibioticus cattleyicolor NRRL 8057 = DSM 46488]MYS58656.1 TetR family transcriptional regulator [Streptomyces sp. SID5468]CCB74326.1 putative transcriptional regulator, TetR family [Streptantibioticus cattleyicolor NRRL 8057 = DSM 46488]